MNLLKRLIDEEDGATATEYAICSDPGRGPRCGLHRVQGQDRRRDGFVQYRRVSERRQHASEFNARVRHGKRPQSAALATRNTPDGHWNDQSVGRSHHGGLV